MSYRARCCVSHDGIWAHRGVQPGRAPERDSRLEVPRAVLGQVSGLVELVTENITMRPVDPARNEEGA